MSRCINALVRIELWMGFFVGLNIKKRRVTELE